MNYRFMFIFDKKAGKIILARDRVGVRPLFYGWNYDEFNNSKRLAVASEAKCLWMCQEIHHVLPGSWLEFHVHPDNSNIQLVSEEFYYEVKKTITLNQNVNFLKPLLEEAVRIRLLSDRPIGCLLSGGLDSSVITSILCKLMKASNKSSKDIRTYSIGMEGSLDLKYARKVADHLGTTHTEVKFTPEEGFKIIPEVIRILESFDITTVRASVGMYLLGKFIKEHSEDKVIFSGEGADELLCGYVYFHNAPNGSIAQDESLRLISELYKYDCLRADRCISSNGLELRVPFLDKNVLKFCTHLHGEVKKPSDGIEKRILRELFSEDLPEEVAWRRKDGFSDGVSSLTKSWYEYIQEFVDKEISDEEFLNHKDLNFSGFESSSISKEAYYYKKIYYRYFPFYPNPIDRYWMPKWSGDVSNNPSGRVLKAF